MPFQLLYFGSLVGDQQRSLGARPVGCDGIGGTYPDTAPSWVPAYTARPAHALLT